MAVTISIQETIITPAKDGVVVQLYVSDAPRDNESAAMRVALTATIPRTEGKRLAWVQYQTLLSVHNSLEQTMNVARDAMTP
jgi:hypothetical protein